jgi:hypothetical protein
MADFRHDPMETREGKGVAKRAWDAYASGVRRAGKPIIEPLAGRVSAAVVTDLLGFWLTWHLEGGFEGLEAIGMHRATIFRKVSRFRSVFGKHPDEFEMPGVTIDLDTYHAADRPRRKSN